MCSVTKWPSQHESEKDMTATEHTTMADAPTIETVTFKLQPGTDATEFVEAAKATEALLQRKGARIERRMLIQDDDGLWTDVVHWQSEVQAKAMAVSLMEEPEFAMLMPMIDPETVTVRHSAIHWATA